MSDSSNSLEVTDETWTPTSNRVSCAAAPEDAQASRAIARTTARTITMHPTIRSGLTRCGRRRVDHLATEHRQHRLDAADLVNRNGHVVPRQHRKVGLLPDFE